MSKKQDYTNTLLLIFTTAIILNQYIGTNIASLVIATGLVFIYDIIFFIFDKSKQEGLQK